MTDFTTALHSVLVQLTHTGDQRVKAVQFQSICNLCRESHKTQVWLCFLAVSFLSISTCEASVDTRELQQCFKILRDHNRISLQRSDAKLYAPPADLIEDNCEHASLKCYMEELTMVLNEEEIEESVACIFDSDVQLTPRSGGCPACEMYPLENITTFLERLDSLLTQMNSQSNS